MFEKELKIKRLDALLQVDLSEAVWRHIDRMNDIAVCDPAEKILEDFLSVVNPLIDKYLDEKDIINERFKKF